MKTPEEALAAIKKAAEEDKVSYASDALCTELDDEIQRIYTAIRIAERGASPKYGVWTADGQRIKTVMSWDDNGKVTEAAEKAVAEAGRVLGIPLSPMDIWEEAALRLRDKDGLSSKS